MASQSDITGPVGTDKIAPEPPPEVTYRSVPYPDSGEGTQARPTWYARFELVSDLSKRFGLAINGEVELGRGRTAPDFVDLSTYNAEGLGVSRRHVMLRSTPDKLYVIDLGSTNGTWRNGRSIGVNTPYHLVNGDTLALGKLEFIVRIIGRPSGGTAMLRDKADLADALTQTAKAITSQLELDEVLNQVAETAMSLTAAGETGVWLVDEQSGDLFLEAQRGIEDEQIRRMRFPVSADTPVGKVVKTGKPLRAAREPGGEQIKVKTDYLVESLLYVPLTLGGVTFGVLAAAHREEGRTFSERDETLLLGIGDFAAIAVQNSRQYHVTDDALAERVKELGALNELSRAVSSSLDLKNVHAVLMEQVHMHWQVENAGLWLVNEGTKTLSPFAGGSGQPGDGADTMFKIGQGIVGKVAQSGRALVSNAVQKIKGYDAEVDTVGGLKAQSIACVPLYVQKQVVGVLALFNKEDGEFNDRDIERLEAFANPVATAIQNARLFAESERERATVHATINTLSQPLLILNEKGDVIVSNEATKTLVETHLAQLLDGLSGSAGRTAELTLGDKTYLTTIEHVPQIGTIVVMQDITYVKELEQAQQEFVHALTHDLKSPLTAIRAWAHMMGIVEPPLDEQKEGFVGRIIEGTDRMLLMIGQLLDIALLSEAPQSYHTPCHVLDVVRDAMGDLEGVALEKAIQMSLQQVGEPYLIRGDNTRLYRSVLNLVDNAIKYSPKNAKVQVSLIFGDEELAIRVRDNGPGIPEEDLPRIFEKFYRGAQGDSEKPGIGLGLTMVQATAKAHGGTATVRNVKGNGAEFAITLPAAVLRLDM